MRHICHLPSCLADFAIWRYLGLHGRPECRQPGEKRVLCLIAVKVTAHGARARLAWASPPRGFSPGQAPGVDALPGLACQRVRGGCLMLPPGPPVSAYGERVKPLAKTTGRVPSPDSAGVAPSSGEAGPGEVPRAGRRPRSSPVASAARTPSMPLA